MSISLVKSQPIKPGASILAAIADLPDGFWFTPTWFPAGSDAATPAVLGGPGVAVTITEIDSSGTLPGYMVEVHDVRPDRTRVVHFEYAVNVFRATAVASYLIGSLA